MKTRPSAERLLVALKGRGRVLAWGLLLGLALPSAGADVPAAGEAESPQQALRRQIHRDLERMEQEKESLVQARAAEQAVAAEKIRTLEAARREEAGRAARAEKEADRLRAEQQAMKREMVLLKTRVQEAEAARRDKSMREELNPKDTSLAWSLNDVGLLLAQEGRPAEAAALYRRALALMDDGMKRTHPAVGTVWSHLAEANWAQGQLDAAEECYREAAQSFETTLGPRHPRLAVALNGWASVLRAKKAWPEAERLYRRAIAVYERKDQPETMDRAAPLHNLGLLLATQERYEEAGPLLEQALQALEPYPETGAALQKSVVLQTLAQYYGATGNLARATECKERAAALVVKDLLKDN